MTVRDFPTEDVITVAADVMISDRGIDAVYSVLNHVLGDNIFTHQIPAAAKAAIPEILAQHPWLSDIDPPVGDIPALLAWRAAVIAEHGPTVALTPATDPPWVAGRALQDLVEMVGADRVIGVVMPEEGDES